MFEFVEYRGNNFVNFGKKHTHIQKVATLSFTLYFLAHFRFARAYMLVFAFTLSPRSCHLYSTHRLTNGSLSDIGLFKCFKSDSYIQLTGGKYTPVFI